MHAFTQRLKVGIDQRFPIILIEKHSKFAVLTAKTYFLIPLSYCTQREYNTLPRPNGGNHCLQIYSKMYLPKLCHLLGILLITVGACIHNKENTERYNFGPRHSKVQLKLINADEKMSFALLNIIYENQLQSDGSK